MCTFNYILARASQNKKAYEFIQDLAEKLMNKVETYVLEQDDKEDPPITPSQDQNQKQVFIGNIIATSSTPSMNVARDKMQSKNIIQIRTYKFCKCDGNKKKGWWSRRQAIFGCTWEYQVSMDYFLIVFCKMVLMTYQHMNIKLLLK